MKKAGVVAICLLLVAGAAVGGVFLQKAHDENKFDYPWEGASSSQSGDSGSQVVPGVSSLENGVYVKYAFVSPTADYPYGSYEIAYTVSPTIYSDVILAKIAYADGAAVPDTVMSMDHDADNMKVTVHCKAPFTKKIIVTLYASSTPSVKADITFDFGEKLTVTLPNSIALAEGSIPSITPTVSTTGGTKTVDKTVKNVAYAWNATFLQWVNTKAQTVMLGGASKVVGANVGLAASDAASFFSAAFSSSAFLTTKGVAYTYQKPVLHSDPVTVNATAYIGSIAAADLNAEFNGTNPIFDYSCSINGQTYSKSFGLTMSAIPVSAISPEISSYTF